jgi:Basic region leucine zipper
MNCFWMLQETDFEELAFRDNQEQVEPMQEPDTPESDGSSVGALVIDLDAKSMDDASPENEQAAALVEYSDSDESMSVQCLVSSSAPQATERRHSESEDDVQSVDSSAEEAEASTSNRLNTLASKRSRANKKVRDSFNDQEVRRLEARNNFLLRKTAKLEEIRDKIRALVAERLSK